MRTLALVLASFSLIFLNHVVVCINLLQYLHDGYTISLLPNNHIDSLVISNHQVYAKVNELDFKGGDNDNDRYFGFLPAYEASLFPSKPPSQFEAKCFKEYSSVVSSFDETGAELSFKVNRKSSPLCYDLILIATQSSLRFHAFYDAGSYSLNFSWVNNYEKENVEENGFVVFYLPDGVLGSVLDIWKTYQLFNGKSQFTDDMQFYKDYMNITFTNRTIPGFIPDESEIMDGDYLAIFDLGSGPMDGGLSTLIAFGTGSHTCHTAVFMRINGSLYVLESTAGGVMKTLYKNWMHTSPMRLVSIARLRPDLRDKFDSDSALAWFNTVEGLPYGYQNFVYGWIDTVTDNYPPPVTSADLPVLLVLANYLFPSDGSLIFGEGLNQRLGTKNLTLMEILDVCDTRNISVLDVIAYPEQDSYVYANPTGPRMVCDVFVLSLYKRAGIFGDIEFQATELTPKDSYQLQIYDTNWQRPLGCANDYQPGLCQFSGDYWLDLPGFNSIVPYSHMNEKCGALPTEYVRHPANC